MSHEDKEKGDRRRDPPPLYAALALAPLAFLGLMFLCFSPDFPYLDQWEFVRLLEKAYEGKLAFVDFWAQHNEHRLVFPRAILLALAGLTHWEIRCELALNFLLGIGLFAVLMAQLRVTARITGRQLPPGLFVLLSLLVFSLSQWQNWFLGWQMQEFLNLLSVIGALSLLTLPEGGGWHFGAALVLAVVATYSFANGMLVWLIGMPLIALTRGQAGWRWLVCWILVGSAVMASYLYGYEQPGYHPSVWAVFRHPVAYPLYVLEYLGQPLVNYSGAGAAVAGVAGLLLWFGLLVKARRPLGVAAAPYVGLGLYAIGSALLTGVARVDLGPEQAMSSRYVTMANPLWAANLVLAALLLAQRGGERPARLAQAGVLLFTALLVGASCFGAYRWTERYHAYVPVRAELLKDAPDRALLERIYPDPEVLLERREILRHYGLSIFRQK